MSKPEPNWRLNAAATLDILRTHYEMLSEVTVVAYALRRTLEQADPSFQMKFAKNHADVENELSATKAATLHLLEKNAGQLRNDPYWKD
jgi:hypothetical protein